VDGWIIGVRGDTRIGIRRFDWNGFVDPVDVLFVAINIIDIFTPVDILSASSHCVELVAGVLEMGVIYVKLA
jgi:hypothetical protein